MFVRAKTVKGRTYYQAVETYRDEDGRVRHRTLGSLGTHATIAAARAAALARYSLRRGDGDWSEVVRLDRLLALVEGQDYRPDEALEKERRRRLRAATAARREADRPAREEARRRRQDRSEEFRQYLDSLDDTADRLQHDLAALGLWPSAGQIRAARDRLAREHHPDRGGEARRMARINDAYERLVGRASPGAHRRPGTAEPPTAGRLPGPASGP